MSMWYYIDFFKSKEIKHLYKEDNNFFVEKILNAGVKAKDLFQDHEGILESTAYIIDGHSVGNIFDLIKHEIENGNIKGDKNDLDKIKEYINYVSSHPTRLRYSQFEPHNGFMFHDELADFVKKLEKTQLKNTYGGGLIQELLEILNVAIEKELGIYITLF